MKYSLLPLIVLFLVSCRSESSHTVEEQNTQNEEAIVEDNENEAYLAKGKEIAQASFQALSGELMKAMGEGGVANAVQYCNLAAYPLTDSMADLHQAFIKRTSMKYRNAKNAPTETEQAILAKFEEKKAAGEALKPMVEDCGTDSVCFYAPIILQPQCLACHGNPSPRDYAPIKKLYPKDMALGYEAGDLRGMWSIRMKK